MKTQALLIVDHGSKRDAANDMLFDMVTLLQSLKPTLIVVGAHMELADPTIADGIQTCIHQGATHIKVQPFMLSPGRHTTEDIPDMVHDIAKNHPNTVIEMGTHLGVHPKLASLILERAAL